MYVIKRDGSKELLNFDKLVKVIKWACEDLSTVSESEIMMHSQLKVFDGISSVEIHDTLIKSAADLITADTPNYQYVAARLLAYKLRKTAFGDFTPPTLLEHLQRQVKAGRYDKHLLEDYSEADIKKIGKLLVHERDFDFAYSGMKQLESKYLVQDRVTGEIYETPQFAYIGIAMGLHASEPKSKRVGFIKEFYEATSTFKVSLPTPIMAGVRTPTRQFSSCVLIESGDSLNSICKSSNSIIKYVSQRAGIGLNAGAIRAKGSPIRGGEAYHTGCIPFYKHFQTAVKSCSQGGVRGGAATVFYPLWHLEVEDLLVLKNNKGVEENRVRHLDYGVQFNRLMYQRLLDDGDITLFSPHSVKGLYETFFTDQDEFERIYMEAESNPDVIKKTIKASKLFSAFMKERASTGRIYLQNVDHCNQHGPFDSEVAPIKQSNLCLEISLPTNPMGTKDEEIALCTLAGINLGKLETLDDIQPLTDILTRALDNLLDYQNYPMRAAEKNKLRRTLGIGVINYAYYLAKHGVRYSDGSANNLTHELFEQFQYSLLVSSNKLAKDKGSCEKFRDTMYAKGQLPIDWYKKDVDDLHNAEYRCDWEGLRGKIAHYGLRNSTLSALMPSETSSQISNATNGIEPPRGLVSIKASKDGTMKQVVPGIGECNYELLWDIPSNRGYIELCGIMQKFVDQAISANTNYDPAKFSGGKVPLQLLISDMLLAYKYSLKTLYYHNTRDGAGENDVEPEDESGCASGACSL
jgi:ribonucleoside-diphosphate reductase alpha chain